MASSLIACLVDALDRNGIRYCHWKGSYTLAEALSGEKDFDLLVDRACASQVQRVLMGLGFKRAVEAGSPAAEPVSHYFGLDPVTGGLCHVHLYTSLFTGETFLNSHWLPFEAMLLDGGARQDGIRVPERPAELISQVLRYFIKYGSLLDVLYAVRREANEKQAEIRWLANEAEDGRTAELLSEFCPAIDERLFRDCVTAASEPAPLATRIQLGRKVRGRLRQFETSSAAARWGRYASILWHEAVRRGLKQSKGKTPASGGAVVAFVGPEATGKSTLVGESSRWLGRHFRVRVIHAGKPPSSWLTGPANFMLPLLRRTMPSLRTNSQEGHIPAAEPKKPRRGGLPVLLRSMRAVGVAYDRRKLLIRARKAAAGGELVFSDRYPSETVGAMDSPRLEMLEGSGAVAALCNRLARLERRLYRDIPPPDLVIRLRVPLEVAIKRNRDRVKNDKESDAYVESRHRLAQAWSRTGTRNVVDVDTYQPIEDTIQQVKRAVWGAL